MPIHIQLSNRLKLRNRIPITCFILPMLLQYTVCDVEIPYYLKFLYFINEQELFCYFFI